MAALIGLASSSCIVTDKIEFERAINQPVQIAATLPRADSVLAVSIGAQYTLSIQVRDPDVHAAPSPELEAQIALTLDPYEPDFENPANRNPACAPPKVLLPSDEDEDVGSLYQIDCDVDLADPAVAQMLHVGDILLARVLVSDRGFVSGEAPDEATTAVANWLLRVAEGTE
ncbi:MAG: hypothetical protein MUC50_17200 [Myxococcota bacterium]|jgi:hypothetical protein|nr:hypothetical protein [Myxococcota bacterium]